MSPELTLIGFGAFAVALLTWLLVCAVIRIAPRLGLLDRPNSRSSHTRLTPRGGGLGIVLALLIAVTTAAAAGVMGPKAWTIVGWAGGLALVVAGVSFSDDLRSLPSVVRLLMHLATAVVAVRVFGAFNSLALPWLGLVTLPAWAGVVLTAIWIIGLTNVYNFMDGIDGIAGVQGVVTGAIWAALGFTAGVPFTALTGIAVAAACAGFLAHNWSPARIFMGDVGSAFLGFCFGIAPLLFVAQLGAALPGRELNPQFVGSVPVFAGLVVWPFIGDGLFTFVRRLRHGENVLKAHRSHLYQRLTICGWSHARVSQLYLWWAAASALGALAYVAGGAVLRCVALVGAVLSLVAMHWWTVREERRAQKRVNDAGLPQKAGKPLRPRLFLSPPHMGNDEFKFVTEAFEQNWIAPAGPNLRAFEQEFAERIDVKHAVALASGTGALHLALRCVGVRPGDDVFVSTFTFVATANPVVYEGGRPVFIDCDDATWNMDAQLLARALDERAAHGRLPRAVIVAHLYGQCADMDPILAACARHGVPVIEDAAEAVGATYKGRAAGSMGRIGVFSFNGNKIITTSGGGMLVSDDKALVDHAHSLGTQARDPAPHYEHSQIGFNYRLSNVLAGIGRGQLRVLDDRVRTRRRIAARYEAALASLPGVVFMPEADYGGSTRWLTCLTIDPAFAPTNRDALLAAFAAEDIEVRPLWKPMHLQPVFRDRGCAVYGGAVSERLFAQGLCLPSGSAMSDAEQDRVIEVVQRVFAG